MATRAPQHISGSCYKCKLKTVDHPLRGGVCHECWADKVTKCVSKALTTNNQENVSQEETKLVALFDRSQAIASVALSQALGNLPAFRQFHLKAVVVIGRRGNLDHSKYLSNVVHYEAPSLVEGGSFDCVLQRRFATRIAELHNAQMLLFPNSATSVVQDTLRRFFLGKDLRPDDVQQSLKLVSPLASFNDDELAAYISKTPFEASPAASVRSSADTLEQMENLLSKFVKTTLTSFPSAAPNVQKMAQRLHRPSEKESCLLCLQARSADRGILCSSCTIAARDAQVDSVELTINWINEQAENQFRESVKVSRSG